MVGQNCLQGSKGVQERSKFPHHLDTLGNLETSEQLCILMEVLRLLVRFSDNLEKSINYGAWLEEPRNSTTLSSIG
jgi:hypothetical protein